MAKISPKTSLVLQWAVLILLTAVLAVTLLEVAWDIQNLELSGSLHPAHLHHKFFLVPNSLNQVTPGQVQSWMTFHYINLVFKLPVNYLQSQLGITDAHYPNITIDGLAKTQKETSVQELAATQLAIRNYLNGQDNPTK